MTVSRRAFLGAGAQVAGVGLLAPTLACAQGTGAATPEIFGARGDGVTNDNDAFNELAAYIEEHGGGVVSLRPGATYIVGKQTPGTQYAGRVRAAETMYYRAGAPVFQVYRLRRPLVIQGNGATVRTAPGLMFGTFDALTGKPREPATMPYGDASKIADLHSMFEIWECGDVTIEDLILDGNGKRQIIGAGFGDAGHQLYADGLHLFANRGRETVRNVTTHHFLRDGIYLNGSDAGGVFDKVESYSNGRQAMSFTGGRGHVFTNCGFNKTGRDVPLESQPKAGVDIEPENGRPVRDARFISCRFLDNSGVGLVADVGDSADVTFRNCKFDGTTNYAAWPRMPGYRFEQCRFVGPIVNAYASPDPERATHFVDCLFTSDPALSSTGKVYNGGKPPSFQPIADLGGNNGVNVLFKRCRFDVKGRFTLAWGGGGAIFEDCVQTQESMVGTGFPRGVYRGVNTIRGNVDLTFSRFEGAVTVNGQAVGRR